MKLIFKKKNKLKSMWQGKTIKKNQSEYNFMIWIKLQ